MLLRNVRFEKPWVSCAVYALYASFAAVFALLSLLTLCSRSSCGWVSVYSVGACVTGVGCLCLFFAQWVNGHETAERVFALVAPPLLFLFVFIMIPFAVPDESTHINRVFDNKSGVSVLMVPAQLLDAFEWITSYQSLWDFLNIPFDYSLVKETDYVASGYSVICYAVPSLFVSIGVAFGLNAYWLIYLARLVNAVLYLVAGWWMLKRCPVAKPFLLVFLLNPMLLQQEASCSADVLCNIGILCFVVQTLYMKYELKRITMPNLCVLAFFAFLVVACKFVYAPLCLISLVLLPLIGNRRVKIGVVLLVPVLVLIGVLVLLASGYSRALFHLFEWSSWSTFASSLCLTLKEQSGILLWQFMGGNLGWPYMNSNFAPTSIPVPYAWLGYSAVFAGSLFICSRGVDGSSLSAADRALAAVLGVVEIIILFFALWQGSGTSEAVTWHQGRYFIPPALVLAFAIAPSRRFAGAPAVCFWGVAAGLLDLASIGYVAYFF